MLAPRPIEPFNTKHFTEEVAKRTELRIATPVEFFRTQSFRSGKQWASPQAEVAPLTLAFRSVSQETFSSGHAYI